MNKTKVPCPACGSREVGVIDSRSWEDANERRRRRECSGCGHRWTTIEVPIADLQRLQHKARLVAWFVEHVKLEEDET